MAEKPIRVYVDTCVYGGVFDEEFDLVSRIFFQQVRDGRFLLVTSATVAACHVLVSWNFKHLVHVDLVSQYNVASTALGYRAVPICSPPEVIDYAKNERL